MAAESAQIESLKSSLAAATAAASDAYRHTSGLIRVLTVLGQPGSPENLLEQTLIVLSQVFSAVVTATARIVDGRVVVTNSCGLPEGDSAFTEGWPLGGGAAQALSTGRAIARGHSDLGASDRPASVATFGVRSGAWIPLMGDAGPSERSLLILLLHATEGLSPTDLQVLSSVASRLSLVLEARQRSEAVERLAQSSHRLARFLDGQQLYAEAVRLLRDLVDADEARLATVHGDELQLQATSRPGGRGERIQPLAEVPKWSAVRRGEAVSCYTVNDGAPESGAHDEPSRPRVTLYVPVMRDGRPVALLLAARDSTRAFSRDAVETATIFANYVGAAMTNAELYHALQESESSLRLITDSISDLIAVVDAEGRFVYVSPSHDRELGRPQAGLLGSSVTALIHPEDQARVQSSLVDARGPGTYASKVEYRLLTGQDTWVWVESALRLAPSADGTIVLSSRVIDERRRLEDELRHRATHDPLTGLANRVLTAQRLEQALAASGPLHVGLLFCDLDKFKAVNDRLGHDAGDELLLQVANRLRACMRSGDLLARFGGDEFVMVLDGVANLAEVTDIGRRVTRALDAPLVLRGERAEVSASIGGVLGVRGEATAGTMLRDADAAMYVAKNSGSGVEVFDDAASNQSLDRLGIRSDLLHALDRNQLALAYQPICDLPTGTVVGFEALLRWCHPTRGLIPPDVFIPLAEETGAIVGLGDWVLERACTQLAAWQALPGWRQLRMNINLSATQLQRPDLAANMLDVIERSGVRPSDLWLEITEHSSIRSDVTDFATTLRQAGVHFALDDFGTAYSNLSHLKRLPIETLKIDRSFVAGLGTDSGLVKAVLAIADSLGLTAVAEGIETAEQREALVALGCESGQGYLLSPPIAPERATELLVADRSLAHSLPRLTHIRPPAGRRVA